MRERIGRETAHVGRERIILILELLLLLSI
jgi:hypothetical protein